MVVIAGDIPSHYYGKHPHQEINLHADASQSEIYRPFVKRAWRVERPDLFPEIIEKAFQLAESGRPGPVLVSVPMDIFSKEIDTALFERLAHHTQEAAQAVDGRRRSPSASCDAAGDAKTPVIYAGGGVLLADAAAELREFVDQLGIPGRAYADGQGRAARRPSADARHDRLLGHQVHQRQLPQRRLRPRRSARASRKPTAARGIREYHVQHSADRKLIHIDIDPTEIGRNYPGRDRRRSPT